MDMQSNVYKYFLVYTQKTNGVIKNNIFTRERDKQKFEVTPSKLSHFLAIKYSPIIVFFIFASLVFSIVSWLALSLATLTWSASAINHKNRSYTLFFILFALFFYAVPFFIIPSSQVYIYAMNYIFFLFLGLFVYLFIVDLNSTHYNTEGNQYFLSVKKSHPTKTLLIVFLSIFLLSSPFAVFEFSQLNKSPEQIYQERLKNKKVLFPLERKAITKEGRAVTLPPGDYKSEVIDNKVYFTNLQNPELQGFLVEEKVKTDVELSKSQSEAIKKADAIIDGRFYFFIPAGINYHDCDINFKNCKSKILPTDLKEIVFEGKTNNKKYVYVEQNNRIIAFEKAELSKAGAK